ncbi:MAG: hypothetical protein GX558_01860 [Clostridiales bacterium]|nr:hypothetical protein [Clostridiales bacterium]
MAAYRALHNGYQVNADAMRFYRLRRRLEDIQAFVESVLLDNLAPDDVDRSLRCLKRECDLLYAVV